MKRNILTMCLALASTALMAQQYQVTGATPEGAKKVYVKYLEDGTTDSLVVTGKGKFTLIADAAKSLFAKVYTDSGKDAFVLLDGNAKVDFNVGAAKGTKENDGLYAWEQRLQPTEAEIKKLITSFEEHQKNNTLTQEIQSDIMVKYDSLQKILMAEYENKHDPSAPTGENDPKAYQNGCLVYVGDTEVADVIFGSGISSGFFERLTWLFF